MNLETQICDSNFQAAGSPRTGWGWNSWISWISWKGVSRICIWQGCEVGGFHIELPLVSLSNLTRKVLRSPPPNLPQRWGTDPGHQFVSFMSRVSGARAHRFFQKGWEKESLGFAEDSTFDPDASRACLEATRPQRALEGRGSLEFIGPQDLDHLDNWN